MSLKRHWAIAGGVLTAALGFGPSRFGLNPLLVVVVCAVLLLVMDGVKSKTDKQPQTRP